jgi:hypothetical protein
VRVPLLIPESDASVAFPDMACPGPTVRVPVPLSVSSDDAQLTDIDSPRWG